MECLPYAHCKKQTWGISPHTRVKYYFHPSARVCNKLGEFQTREPRTPNLLSPHKPALNTTTSAPVRHCCPSSSSTIICLLFSFVQLLSLVSVPLHLLFLILTLCSQVASDANSVNMVCSSSLSSSSSTETIPTVRYLQKDLYALVEYGDLFGFRGVFPILHLWTKLLMNPITGIRKMYQLHG